MYSDLFSRRPMPFSISSVVSFLQHRETTELGKNSMLNWELLWLILCLNIFITTHNIKNTVQKIGVRIILQMFLKALKHFLMENALMLCIFFLLLWKLSFQQPLL